MTTKLPISVTAKQLDTNIVFRLRATDAASASERKLHIGILLDNSGSMDGTRLTAVKRTLGAARHLFCIGDRLSLVTFSTTARIVLGARELVTEESIDHVFEAINSVTTEGSTNLSLGFEALYSITKDYDVVILLTDGEVNAGITSTPGLCMMARETSATFHTLGYGADHNRSLLKEIAIRSRGTYTYVDSEEILPIAIGDILSGARLEVLKNVRIQIPHGECQEVGAVGKQDYFVGGMITDRDYWSVFRLPESSSSTATITYQHIGDSTSTLFPFPLLIDSDESITDQQVQEQILRARAAVAMDEASTCIESGRNVDLTRLQTIQTELDSSIYISSSSALIMRLRAQIAEIIHLIQETHAQEVTHRFPPILRQRRSSASSNDSDGGPRGRRARCDSDSGNEEDDNEVTTPPPRTSHPVTSRSHLMARLSSGAAILGNQRGIDGACLFSSPQQRVASSIVRDKAEMG